MLVWVLMLGLTLVPLATPGHADGILGSARLQIAGSRLTVAPANQTVPFDFPTLVTTTLAGYDPARGVLPSNLLVVGDFSGPEVDGVLMLETVPNEPFRIPRLRLEGEYRLDNIRLVQDGETLAHAEPNSAVVNVAQILITRVESRALTADEIASYGLNLNADNYQALNLTFAFGVNGREISYDVPVVYDLYGPDVDVTSDEPIVHLPHFDSTVRRTVFERFQPPRFEPFRLSLEQPKREVLKPRGCDINDHDCRDPLALTRPMVGVLLFPTDISLLHQFFSVILMAQNGAPEGDVAVLRDLMARIQLPPGLRLGETDPPALVGSPVRVAQPGSDGELGTADDSGVLAAGETGQAEFVVEGRKEGTHVVNFDLSGVLEGLPTGPQVLTGHARGAVAVRDPSLAVHVAHPESVRADIEYWLYFTITNLATAPVNSLSISFPSHALSGVSIIGDPVQTIVSLASRETETVRFRVRPTRTGRVIASSIKAPSLIDPSVQYSLKVGAGAESPDSLKLPEETASLPDDMVRSALALVGMGYSLAQSPPSLDSGLPRVGMDTITERIYRLKQAGLQVDMGAELFDVISGLALEWAGGRDEGWLWDQLVRETQTGGEMEAALATVLDAASTSPRAALDRLAVSTHFLGPQAVLTVGSGLDLTVASRTSGKRVSGPGLDPDRLRELPFAQVYDLTGGRMTLLASPEEGGYQARWTHSTGGSAEVHLLVPNAAGAPRVVRFTNLSLAAGATATVEFQSGQTVFEAEIDDDGNGLVDRRVTGQVEALTPRPFEVVAAKVDLSMDPSGHIARVLLSQDVDLASLYPKDPARFVIPGHVSNGGLIRQEEDILATRLSGGAVGGEPLENVFEGLSNPLLIQVIFDNPISPLVDNHLTVSNLSSVSGDSLASQTLLVAPSEKAQPGAALEGYFHGADGGTVAFADVVLVQWDQIGTGGDVFCNAHQTAATKTDANGRFFFDYVRQTECGDAFQIQARDPLTGFSGEASGRVARVDETLRLNIVALRRGTIRGRVLYADGTVPENLEVIANNRDFNKGRRAYVDEDGYYNVGEVVVGTVALAAHDNLGNFVYRTVELPDGGEALEQDLVIIPRRLDEPAPGQVRGVVTYDDGEPVHGASIALYVEDQLIGTRRSGPEGRFDFGLVPSGIAEIEVFAEASLVGAAATGFDFEIHPDQVSDLDLKIFNVVGSIEGYIYNKSWNGTVTAKSEAIVWVEGTPFNTVSDENGFYRFDRIFAGNWKVKAADAESGVSVFEQVSITSEAESSGVPARRDLYFDQPLPAGGLVGRVLNHNGQPVSGAKLRIAGGYYAVRWWVGTTTDANGYYAFEGLGPGSYGIHALKDNDGTVGFTEILYPGHTAHLDLQFRDGKVRIETVARQADGSEVPVISHVEYRCVQVIDDWSLVAVEREYNTASTRPEDGILEIDCLMGPYEAYVHNPFHETLDLEGYSSSAKGELIYDGEVRHHKIVYSQNGTIRGRLLATDGATPVAGATVSLHGGGFSDFDVTTDENGLFEFRLVPRGSYRLVALHDTGVIFRTAEIGAHLNTSGGEIDVEIELPEQGSVLGEVRTAGGESVPGAVVTLWESSYPRRRLVQVADLDGRYAFHNVFVGDVMVRGQAPSLGGLAGRMQDRLDFEAQELAVIVTLEATGEITGLLTNPDTGLPAPNAEVQLVNGFSLVEAQNTDENGEYRFRLLPTQHTYQIRAFDAASGRRGLSAWIGIEEHNQVVAVDTTLENRGSVDGHFYDGDAAASLPAHLIRLKVFGRLKTYSTTDENGYFRFDGIPQGSFNLFARDIAGRRHVYENGTIQEEDELVTHDLWLSAFGEVTARVLNPIGSINENGLFPDANTRLIQNDVIGAGFDNPITFEGVLPGQSFSVWATENGGLRQGRTAGILDEEGQDITLDVRMQGLGSSMIEVFEADGVTPATGVEVALHNDHRFHRESFIAGTGVGNTVTFGDVREGNLWAVAKDPVSGLRGSASGELTLDGERVDLRVLLEPTAGVRGRIVLVDGITPAPFASLALNRNGKWILSETDAEGVFVFDTIPLGIYTLIAQEAGGLGTIERHGTFAVNLEMQDLGTLVLDDEDPRVVSVFPNNGAVNLPLATPIVITFSEPIDAARTGNAFELRKATGQAVGFSRSWSADLTAVTLTPNGGSLASGTGYDIVARQQVYDLAGRDMSWPVRSTFQTADVIPPAPIDILPANGAVQVPIESTIYVLFSEPIDLASLSGTALQLTDLTAGQGVTTTVQLRPGEREIILTPQLMPEIGRNQLMYSDRLMQVLIQNVADLAGNVMPEPVVTTFWTPDETLPELTWLTPSEGETFTSGDNVPILVDATDNRGVAQVVFEIGEWSTVLQGSGAPAETFSWDIPAPVVAQSSAIEIRAIVTDIYGNDRTFTRGIDVDPRQNASAPIVVPGCPVVGDRVAPGLEVPVSFAVSDDEAVESYWLDVDGERVDVVTPANIPSASALFLWTPAAGALPGDSFELQLGGRDFAGNVTVHAVVVSVTNLTVLAGDQNLDAAGGALALAAGTFDLTAFRSFTDLEILHGAELEAPAGLALDTLRLQCGGLLETSRVDGGDLVVGGELRPDLESHLEIVAQTVTVLLDGSIDSTGRGYPGGFKGGLAGAPAWVTGSTVNAGGSHGGRGVEKHSGNQSGEVFGSVYMPMHGGGGGGGTTSSFPIPGSAGGGGILVRAATLELEGEIRSRGGEEEAMRGGGGGILVDVETLSGAGLIDARGANPCESAGGGGRVAIFADTLSGFDPSVQALAWGGGTDCQAGEFGGAGTVYVRTLASNWGSLLIDNGTTAAGNVRVGPVTELPVLGSGAVIAFEAAGADAWVTGAETFLPRWRGAAVSLEDAVGQALITARVLDVDAGGRMLVEGVGAVSAAVSYRGKYLFDALETRNNSSFVAGDPIEVADLVVGPGESAINSEISATNVVIQAGATVYPAVGATLRIAATESLTLEAGAVIDVSGLGYPGGPKGGLAEAPAWVTGSTDSAGGSHGGRGSATSGKQSGESFDSVYWPSLGGGGGGGTTSSFPVPGSAGGGVVHLSAASLELEGTVVARGGEQDARRGAGGSVLIEVGTLSGSGLIDVAGADTCETGGGGGRIAIHADTLVGFDPSTQARAQGGGVDCVPGEFGGPGTVYLHTSSSTWGNLVIDNGTTALGADRSAPATELPPLGSGSISAIEDDGGNAWLTAASPFTPRWRGVWVVLTSAAGSELGEFRVISVGADGRLLLDGAAGVSGATDYSGQYRFDELELRHGADLTSDDPIVGPALVIEGEIEVDGEITANNMVLRSGAVIRSISPFLHLRVSGTLTIESGAVIDASGQGYPGGPKGGFAEAPPWVVGSTDSAGGSHGGRGAAKPGKQSGEVFGSVYMPSLGGGGGGGTTSSFPVPGSAGGGVILVEASRLELEGTIVARGGADNAQRGSGGSVLIDVAALTGEGLIDVRGADPCETAGGGGRVGIHADTLSGFDPTLQTLVWGGGMDCQAGEFGGAGTMYVKTLESTWGSLWIDNGTTSSGADRPGPTTELPTLGSGTVTVFEVAGADAWVTGLEAFRPRWWGAAVTLEDVAGQAVITARVLDIDVDGRILLEGAGAVVGAATFRGRYLFDSVETRHGSSFVAADPVEVESLVVGPGESLINPVITASIVVIRGGATVQPATGDTLHIEATQSLTIEAGAVLDVSGLGYPGGPKGGLAGAPEQVTGSTNSAGGSHGGRGAAKSGQQSGESFDSVYWPSLGGGGGGGTTATFWSWGSPGGGVVRLEAASLELEGTILARGGVGGAQRGAGGSVLIEVETLSGAGSIDVGGAEPCDTGGGGGRIAIHANALAGFDPAARASLSGGGVDCGTGVSGGPGTLFVHTGESTWGDLWIVHSPGVGAPARTELPAIGTGTVDTVTVDTDDLTSVWIEPSDLDLKFSVGVVGMWARIGGVDYPVIAERLDRRGLLLEGAAGSVQVGDAFVGIYKFDHVTVSGGAYLESHDGIEAATWDVDASSTVESRDIHPPVFGVITPVAGSSFTSSTSIPISAEVTDATGVSRVTFELAGQSFIDEEEPWQWSRVAPAVAVATTLTLNIEAEDSEGHVASTTRMIQIDPLPSGDPPVVTSPCLSPGAMLAPGTGLDIAVDASHQNGIEKVEYFLGASSTPEATLYSAPYTHRLMAPAAAAQGDVLQVRVVARAWGTSTAELTFDIGVIEGAVLTTDTTLSAGDLSLDGGSVVVAGGRLTIDGAHDFEHLVVLNDATVTHPPRTSSSAEAIQLGLTGNLYIACGAAIDATGVGDPLGALGEATAGGVGGSHGGRGGLAGVSGQVHGSLFDPDTAGGPGGGPGAGGAGGGVIRLAAQGDLVIDGAMLATGDASPTGVALGAGGSIRLDAASLTGFGSIDASGGGAAAAAACGGGGRVALYLGSADASFLSRVTVTGGACATSAASGSAGTLFIKRDSDPRGELVVDNGAVLSLERTPLPVVGSGIVDAVSTDGLTDDAADFIYHLTGTEVFLGGDQSRRWTILANDHHGKALTLDVATVAFNGLVGETYAGLYRFDRVTVRGNSLLEVGDVYEIGEWVVDEGSDIELLAESEPPVVTSVLPPAGSSHQSGVVLTFMVQATDMSGVAQVGFHFGPESFVDTAEPWEWSLTVPDVAVITDMDLVVEAVDIRGNQGSESFTYTVEPNPAGSGDIVAPVLTVADCPADQDRVVPGSTVTFPLSASDEEGVTSSLLKVNGQVVATGAPAGADSVDETLVWTVDPAAPPGTYSATVEVRDAAGNLASETRQLIVPAGIVLSGDQSLDNTHDGQHLTVAGGTFTVTEPLTLASFSLVSGARVVGESGEALELISSGEIHLSCDTSIDVTGQGFGPGATYANETAPGNASGGSHLGVGGRYFTSAVGSTYGSLYRPRESGGGGQSTSQGSPGGGVVRIMAADLTVASGSSIRANGEGYPKPNSSWTRGGAGGSVWITADTISGAGTIEAFGGVSGTNQGGSGGGGAIAVEYGASSGTVLAGLGAQGGAVPAVGGAGTVYLHGPSSTYGDLMIDNGTLLGARTVLPSLGVGIAQAGSSSGSGSGVLMTDLVSVPDYFVGHWVEIYDGATENLKGTWRVSAISGGTLTLEDSASGAVSVASGDLWQGVYRFDNLSLDGDLLLESEDPVRVLGTQEISGRVELTSVHGHDLVLRSGAFLTHPATTTAASPESLHIELTGTLSIEAGASIDVTGQGLRGDVVYPGEVLPGNGSGGSHMGVGGRYFTSVVGSTYGSLYHPRESGGGGQSTSQGSSGGGVVRIIADGLAVATGGSIRANGEGYPKPNSSWTRGGGGGSVWITVGTISGAGTIEAFGGVSGTNQGGSGGGGAIAVEYGASSGTVLAGLEARGGAVAAVGGAGTVYLHGPSSTYGDLVIDNGTLLGGRTVLPSLGVGSAQAGSGSNLLVTDLGTVPSYFVGHWVELYDGPAGDLKGTWRVSEINAGSLALEAGVDGVPSVAAGDTWQGVYRFDDLVMNGDLLLESEDPIRVLGTHEISGTVESRVIMAHHLVLRSGAVLTHPATTDPAAPERLRIELTGTLTLEAGALIDVTGQGYRLNMTHPAATLAGNGSGASHLGVGGQYQSYALGSTYGSVYRPIEPGSGSEHGSYGKAGGGVVRLIAADLTLASGSAIRANGAGFVAGNSNWMRGGAGGSVWITVSGAVSGDGTIEAGGGFAGSNGVGSGGGGAITLEYGSLAGTVADNLVARGGNTSKVGGAGSIYLFPSGSTWGDLVLDNGGFAGQGIALPALGGGTAQAGSTGLVLVTDRVTDIPAYFVGHWVEISTAGGSVKGTFRIAWVDGVSATLELASGESLALEAGDLWRGVYLFDSVTVTGAASLTSTDPVFENGVELDL